MDTKNTLLIVTESNKIHQYPRNREGLTRAITELLEGDITGISSDYKERKLREARAMYNELT